MKKTKDILERVELIRYHANPSIPLRHEYRSEGE